MALSSDEKGFLAGEAVDTDETNKLLTEIRDEFRSFRTDLSSIGVKLETPRPAMTETLSTRSRDSQGRFGCANPQSKPEKSTSSRSSPGFIGHAASNIGNTAKGIGSRSIEYAKTVDPTFDALSTVSSPAITAFHTLFSSRYKPSDKENTSWLKRKLKELKLSRRDNTQYSKASVAQLKKIESKPVTSGSKGSDSFLGALLGAVLPVLTAIFTPIAGAIVAGGTAAWGLFNDSGKAFFSSLSDKVLDGWNTAISAFKDTFKPLVDLLKDSLGFIPKTVSKATNSANQAIKDSTRIRHRRWDQESR